MRTKKSYFSPTQWTFVLFKQSISPLGGLVFSPLLNIASYRPDDSYGPVCLTQADTPWRITFFSTSIVVFYIIPCFILIMLYSRISKNLMKPAPGLIQTSSASLRYRKQVIIYNYFY